MKKRIVFLCVVAASQHDPLPELLCNVRSIYLSGCHYAAFELLDQEVTGEQVDFFDSNTIRMKTSGEYVEGFEPTM